MIPFIRSVPGDGPWAALAPHRDTWRNPSCEVVGSQFRLKIGHGIILAAAFGLFAAAAEAGPGQAGVIEVIVRWTPLLFKGFLSNLAISVMAMALGTIAGIMLGVWQISPRRLVRKIAWTTTQFFRNSPWLVLLFFCMLLLPFELKVRGATIPLPDWIKATFGLSLPVMANVSEIVRGAIQSIPAGQWEAAEALAFHRRQTMRLIIMPQCVKRMLPPWMNLYAILTMATVLVSVVGVSEVMTLTGQALAAEGGRTDLLIPFYAYVLLWFFIYCYPIARLTLRLERKFLVKT